jgi:hypothetical protein
MNQNEISGYRWESAELSTSHDFLLPTVLCELKKLRPALTSRGGGEGV